jgi:hypothetical protein
MVYSNILEVKSKFLLASIKITDSENHFGSPLQSPYIGDFDPENA